MAPPRLLFFLPVPPPACSYCNKLYTGEKVADWLKCSRMDCNNCGVLVCSTIRCREGYKQHINRVEDEEGEEAEGGEEGET